MLKLFLRLYLVLALVLALFFVGAALLPNSLLKNTLADYFQRLAGGTYSLIMRRLQDLPRAQWPQEVRRIGERFGYPLDMHSRDALDLPDSDLRRLRSGHATYVKQDNVQIWYLPVADTEYVLSVHMAQSHSEHGRRMTIGTFSLIEEQLSALPHHAWPKQLAELQGLFWFPVTLERTADIDLPTDQRKTLLDGEILSFGVDTNTEWFLHRLPSSPYVLKLGPMSDPLVFRILAYIVYSILALLIAIAVWLWVRPLWGGVLEMRRVTGAFGRGELRVRATLPKRAPLRMLAETFNQMAERIQGLVESHRNLTNAVSHELRTPISRLRFGLEMLERSDSRCDRHRYLTGMQVDVQELEDLVEELLVFSRLEREAPTLSPAPRSVMAWLASLCESESLFKGIELLGPLGSGAARFDDRLLGRAVVNLLRNAGAYAVSQVRVSCCRQGAEMALCVEDDGPGVPEAERERIFEPFARMDRSRDRETGGYGLGLAIVHRVMELHAGRVEVSESDLGGACFRLLWPTE